MTSMTSTGIAYDDRGPGDHALLFMPGWCGPRTLFEPLADRVERTRRAIALDWRGHGDSKPADGDFGAADLVDDALAVIDQANVTSVVPVAVAHAGWVAIELRRRLGPARVPRLVFLDWMVLGAPPPFVDALAAMSAPATTRGVVEQVTAMWVGDVDLPALSSYVASMAAMPDEMWARGAREIARAFSRFGTPLEAVDMLEPPPPTLHMYAQPADPGFLAAQHTYAARHRWFSVEHLDALSHFPIFEVPEAVAEKVCAFTDY